MAKKAKKTSKKKEEEVEEVEEVEEHVVLPQLPAGVVNVVFSREELAAFASLMSICAQTFQNLAVQALEAKDDNASNIFSARQKLSSAYASKLISSFSIGEPESRDVH
jgi:hypothetical protein